MDFMTYNVTTDDGKLQVAIDMHGNVYVWHDDEQVMAFALPDALGPYIRERMADA
jgi:hypothetical protein